MNPIYRCGAKRRNGEPCTQVKMKGGARCRMHGGQTPQVKRAAAARLAQAKAGRAVARLGLAPVDDPVGELRSLAAEALGVKEFFRQRVDALRELRYEGVSGEQLRSEVSLYERGLDRAGKFLESLAKLNLEDRSVRIDEAKVVMLASILQRVLAAPELALDGARQVVARTLLVEALEAAP